VETRATTKVKATSAKVAQQLGTNTMSIAVMKQALEKLATSKDWVSILEPAGYLRQIVERLNSGEILYQWVFDRDGIYSEIQTWSETESGIIIDLEHKGKRELSKFDAILRLRCGGDFNLAKKLLTETLVLGESPIDQIGRIKWREYLQTANEMSPDVLYYTSELFQAQADAELSALISKEYAKNRFEELAFAQEGEHPQALTLKEITNLIFEGPLWVIKSLMMAGSKTFIAAKAKTGKTTLVLSLIESLLSGKKFLNKFDVNPVQGHIGCMNLELTERQMQMWVKRLQLQDEHMNRLHIWNLRGKPNPFRSEVSRERLIEELRERGIKTLIIDPFSKVFGGNGNDNSEVSRFLQMLDRVLDRAGVEQLIMLVHAGNDARKIRGATALTDHPDGVWFMVKDDDSNRYLSAMGRDIELEDGLLAFDRSTNTFQFSGEKPSLARAGTSKEKMMTFIKSNPGSKVADIDDSVSGTKAFKIKLRKQLVSEGLVIVRKGPNNSDLYFAV
jgi:hypothetical protein